jgi:hypothetical protein
VLQGELRQEGEELTVPLETTATQAKLTLMGKDAYTFFVGGLGPAESHDGARARLLNLGFGRPATPSSERAGPSAVQVRDPLAVAISAFQARNDLSTTGALDEPTVAALESAYSG